MTDDQRATAATVVRWTAILVAVFIVLSLVAQFLLVWRGILPPDEGGVFKPIFDLVTLLVGMVAGYVARGADDDRTRDPGPGMKRPRPPGPDGDTNGV